VEDLEKIEIVKQRLNCSYEVAGEALERTGGDVVQALILLEEEKSNGQKQNDKKNVYKVKGQQLLNKIKEIIREGNASKIIVKNNTEETLVEIPITAGVIGLVLFPYIGILAGMVAMYKEYILEIERNKNIGNNMEVNSTSTTVNKKEKTVVKTGKENGDSYSSYKYEYE